MTTYVTPGRESYSYETPSRDAFDGSGGGGGGSGALVPAAPRLSNVDFKKLMMTPRRTDETPMPDYLSHSLKRKKKDAGGKLGTAEDFFAKRMKTEKSAESKAHHAYRRSHKPRDRAGGENDGDGGDGEGEGAGGGSRKKYRDRAKERAKGENPDYAKDEDMLREVGLPVAAVVGAAPAVAAAVVLPRSGHETPGYTPSYTPAYAAPATAARQSGGSGVASSVLRQPPSPLPFGAPPPPAPAPPLLSDSAAAQRNREIREQIEKSKYLGGDARHTHLVKGLDFALLQKARQEAAQREQKERELREEAEKKRKKAEELQKAAHPAVATAAAAGSVGFGFGIGTTTATKDDSAEAVDPAAVRARALAQNVMSWVFPLRVASGPLKPVEAFLPRRTAYVISFDASAPPIPATRIRPRHEVLLLTTATEGSRTTTIRAPVRMDATLLQHLTVVCADRRKGLYGSVKDRKRREATREKEKEKKKFAEEAMKRLNLAEAAASASAAAASSKKATAASLEPDEIFPGVPEYRP